MQIRLASGTEVKVHIRRKKVIRMTLRVYPGGEVRVTVPIDTPETTVRSFVHRYSEWLEASIYRCANHDPKGTIRWKGKAFDLCRQESPTRDVQRCGDRLLVFGPTEAACHKTFDEWWRQQLLEVCGEYLAKWYPVMRLRGYSKPVINVRKMQSTWGSCTPKTAQIRFNYYLLCAPLPEIEYVVLHELAHLEFPDHGRRFAAFMTEHMPDWKERRDRLNSCARYIGSF